MKIRHLTAVSAAAAALLSTSGMAMANGACSNATLRGAYAFSAEGETLGLVDGNNTLHRYDAPAILNDVALVTYDGHGTFTRTDVGDINGVPKFGQTDFTSNQRGAYGVKADCTGWMQIVYDNNTILNLKMVIGDDGTLVKAIIITETIPSSLPTPDTTACPPSCNVAAQVNFEGKKVIVYGIR